MNLAIQPPGWDSPPEPTKEDIRNDVTEHAKRYNNAKEDLEGALAEIEEFKNAMKLASAHLWYHYSIEEKDIESISNDD